MRKATFQEKIEKPVRYFRESTALMTMLINVEVPGGYMKFRTTRYLEDKDK